MNASATSSTRRVGGAHHPTMPKDDLANLRLDLAPKLNRPLSLWNPLDYLRLLVWVFYSPRTLCRYVDHFGRENSNLERTDNQSLAQKIFGSETLTQLLIQGFISTAVSIFFLGVSLTNLREESAWMGAILFAILIAFSFTSIFSSSNPIASKLALFTSSSITFFVAGFFFSTRIIEDNFVLIINDVSVIFLGIALGITVSTIASFGRIEALFFQRMEPKAIRINQSSRLVFWKSLRLFVNFFFLATGSASLLYSIWFLGISKTILAFLIFFATLARLDSLVLGSLLTLILPRKFFRNTIFSAILPFPYLIIVLQESFRRDWSLGIHNLNEIAKYANNLIPASIGIARVLKHVEEQHLIEDVSSICQSVYVWDIIPSSVALMKSPFYGKSLRNNSVKILSGFWYLHEEQPANAARDFTVALDIRHGKEMHGLASLLALFDAAETAEQIAAIDLPELPADRTLRPQSWEAIRRFYHVVSDTKTAQASASRAARAFATNRALGELQRIIEDEADLPEAERSLVIEIAKTWQNALLDITAAVGELNLTQPVQNPYVIGDPVEGDLFVGREDIMRQLQDPWMGNHLQSVVIYGHRRMGKTSILKNVGRVLGSGLRVAYVNLLKSAGADNLSDVLLAISDQVAATLAIPPPKDADMANSPARTFERFLRRATNSLADGEGLIIALDEFEKIEELIRANKLETSFWDYLRGLVQDSPKVGFALAGLHSLEEMSSDYSKPFFASLINIKVDFFTQATVQALLPNPGGDFPLDYDYDALDLIYALTAGQPYLTQLLGFQLVRRYNDQVFEQQQPREAKFTVADVQAVVERPEFFAQGKPYFAGIWAQASHDAPGQQRLLQALAPHPEGLSIDELQRSVELDPDTFGAALGTLAHHDVVQVEDGTAQIIVEVFRRWVMQQKYPA